MKEQELKPCPFVGMDETCPAYPSRCAPAGQWSSEPPTEEGYYWVCLDRRMYKHVLVEDDDGILIVREFGCTGRQTLDKFCDWLSAHYPLKWLPIPIPPLPGGESEGKNGND
jgi:hypothetical protein